MSPGRSAARLALVVAALARSAPGAAEIGGAVQGAPALDESAALEVEADAEPARSREVEAGDTLWSIAASAMGDGTLWPALYRANRDRIKDPARIYPGQHLAVPEVDPESVASVRREGAALAAH